MAPTVGNETGGFPSQLWRLALTYALALAAGAGASWLRMPLPWMLGPFFVFAALSATGRLFPMAPKGRELAQVVIGLAVGLRFTAPVVAAMIALLPEMLGATVYLLLVTTAAAFVFRWLGGVDPVTAFFATAAGGVADMAMVAIRYGGVASSVAVVHAMRMALVVATAPFIVLGTLGRPTGGGLGPPGTLSDLPLLAGGLLAAWLVSAALNRSPLPNPWLVGSILAGMILALIGLTGLHVPGWLIILAQLLLGVWLGCQFRRDLLTALPRVTAAAFASGIFLIAMAALGAAVLAQMGRIPFATAFLSLAPAAVTEMVLVARAMHLDSETVAAFHVMRIVIVSTSVLGVFKLYTTFARIKHGS